MNIRTDLKRNQEIFKCEEKSLKALAKILHLDLLVLPPEQKNYKMRAEMIERFCSNFLGYPRNNEIDDALTHPYIHVQIFSLQLTDKYLLLHAKTFHIPSYYNPPVATLPPQLKN